MRAMTRDAMRDGALGIYSALMYSPDVYNSTDELIAMAKVASEYGGYYQTHQRSESSAIDASLDEIFRIAREARISAHITHFKVTQTQNWGRMAQVLERIEVARAEGLDVTADLYPYEWAGGSFTALLPPWVQDGGRAEIMRRLRDGPTRDRIKADLVTPTLEWENEYLGAGGGPAGILIVNANGNRDLERYEGKTVADIARAEERDPRDVVLDIILAGDASMVVHITNEPDLRLAIARPWMMVGSDGSGRTAPDGPLARGGVHPRGSGTFPKVFNDYVRTSPILTLEEFVRRCTSLSAKRLSLKSRGMLRPGYFADIVVFDPDQYRDHATYEKPRKLATGVDHVLVNGAITFFDGAWTGARAGRPLRGPGWRRG
jgi:N-acyl-D-aspartate/D-glutamate deacylase